MRTEDQPEGGAKFLGGVFRLDFLRPSDYWFAREGRFRTRFYSRKAQKAGYGKRPPHGQKTRCFAGAS